MMLGQCGSRRSVRYRPVSATTTAATKRSHHGQPPTPRGPFHARAHRASCCLGTTTPGRRPCSNTARAPRDDRVFVSCGWGADCQEAVVPRALA